MNNNNTPYEDTIYVFLILTVFFFFICHPSFVYHRIIFLFENRRIFDCANINKRIYIVGVLPLVLWIKTLSKTRVTINLQYGLVLIHNGKFGQEHIKIPESLLLISISYITCPLFESSFLPFILVIFFFFIFCPNPPGLPLFLSSSSFYCFSSWTKTSEVFFTV